MDRINSIIEVVNQLYKVIQLQDADEGAVEDHTQEHMLPTSKSIGGEILLETSIDGSGGTALKRSQSAPHRNLRDPVDMILRLHHAARLLKRNLMSMQILQYDVEEELDKHLRGLSKVFKGVQCSRTMHVRSTNDLEDITKKFLELRSQVPVLSARWKKKKGSQYSEGGDGDNNGKVIVCLPGIYANEEDLKRLAVFRQVEYTFKSLSTYCQICLLSFAVFPENREVNGTMLMYWWIGEGILPVKLKPPQDVEKGSLPDKFESGEDVVKDILKQFMDKKLIEPVENNRKVEPSTYKMNPFVHSSVVTISTEIGLFDIYRKGKKPSMNKSNLNKVCLVEGSSRPQGEKGKKMENADHIETVFNVSEMFPDFICKWFSNPKVLKVLYLGRWERNEREIEVDSRRVMKHLSSMRKLRFLSFQGISTIKTLSRSACKLTKLIILDLRDCYNLEKLPEDIHKLKSLVYLDLTGCEALESIPVNLAALSNLEVLKGFVVSGDREISCKLIHLKRLLKLRKLNVTVDIEDFGLHELLVAIEKFNALVKLKVQWGSGYTLKKKKKLEDGKQRTTRVSRETPVFSRAITRLGEASAYLPPTLKKLELQRFPDNELPDCLHPDHILSLEKLHLGSSRRLKGFGESLPKMPTRCNVKVLRLKCLQKLRVEWTELTQLYFPKLSFLEVYECPRVTFCPCDRDGIWRSKPCETELEISN